MGKICPILSIMKKGPAGVPVGSADYEKAAECDHNCEWYNTDQDKCTISILGDYFGSLGT